VPTGRARGGLPDQPGPRQEGLRGPRERHLYPDPASPDPLNRPAAAAVRRLRPGLHRGSAPAGSSRGSMRSTAASLGHAWVKVHIMTGVRPNIITAAEIHGQDANDAPILPPGSRRRRGLHGQEVPADKGYSSVETSSHRARLAHPVHRLHEQRHGRPGGRWGRRSTTTACTGKRFSPTTTNGAT